MRQFLSDFNYTACIDTPISEVPYTYVSALGSSSRIDHFIVTSALSDNLLECSIIDNLLFSDHVPLKIRLDLTVENVSIKERTYCSRVAWNKASSESIDRYRDDVELKLSRIVYDKDTLQCKDTSCTCKGHVDKLGVFYRQILNTCTEASQFMSTTAPVSESRPPKGGRVIPGWSQEVENLKQQALFWHRQWRSRGRPHNGDITERRRITRARYHQAIRQIIKRDDLIRTTRMAEAICDNRTRDLWAEVRKIKGRNKFQPSSIDGIVNEEDIARCFSLKYNDLYNSVPSDNGEMISIDTEINNRVKDGVTAYDICVDDTVKGVRRLKLGKSDGEEGLSSDHIINGPRLLYVLLTMVFNSMLIHGVSPESMLVGTMIPIPKDRRQLRCTSDNFRAITLSSIVGKLLDLIIILSKEQGALLTSQLQFGFKENMSTTQCTYVMQETISYYNAIVVMYMLLC